MLQHGRFHLKFQIRTGIRKAMPVVIKNLKTGEWKTMPMGRLPVSVSLKSDGK